MEPARNNSTGTAENAIRRVVTSAVRLAFRWGVAVPAFIELVKQCFVDVASDELKRSGSKVNVSRISVATGLSRQEIMRLDREDDPAPRSASLIAKILGQWEADKRFSGPRGPRPLSTRAGNDEFAELARSVSTNVHPASVLSELLRSGLVERSGSKLVLLGNNHNNPGLRQVERGYELLGRGIEGQILAAQENIASTAAVTPNLYVHTSYDNIRPEAKEEIRAWFKREGVAFHRRAREFLSQFDKDINPDIHDKPQKGISVELMSYSLISNEPEISPEVSFPATEEDLDDA